jgi:hypothetical protein
MAKAAPLKVGDLVHPGGQPTEIYRVDYRLGAGRSLAFTVLPYQRSGKQVVIMAISGRWSDGSRAWVKL